MQFRVSPKTLGDTSAEEWQARVDLAAAHRLAYMHGFSEGIFNHLTLVVPGSSDRYYQIPFGMHWSEVTASSFMEVGIDDGKIKRGAGCDRCNNSGYKGRCGLYEVLQFSDEIRDMILSGASSIELKRKAIEEGMVSLRMAGLQKIRDGVTTLEEVLRESVL